MSRTEGILLPRLPTTHTRVTSPGSIQPLTKRPLEKRARSFSEPHHTAYIGTPRQDVPISVYFNAVDFDDVFDKEGRLLGSRNMPKITCPLNALQYNSLNDPHCRRLFLNNGRLREHLMNLGLITNDLKVVATTKEQRQKIRAHELLERKEQLLQKMERREEERLQKLQSPVKLPSFYARGLINVEARRQMQSKISEVKLQKALAAERERKKEQRKKCNEERKQLKDILEESQLAEQARRNAAMAEQEMAEAAAYEKQYGKYGNLIARWHRDSDAIHNRMKILEHTKWSRMRRHATQDQEVPSSQTPMSNTRPHAVTMRDYVSPDTPPATPVLSLPLPKKTAKPSEGITSVNVGEDTMTTKSGGAHKQQEEIEFHNQTPMHSGSEQKVPPETSLQSPTVPMQNEDHRTDPTASQSPQPSDIMQQPSVTAPTQTSPASGVETVPKENEPISQTVPPLRSGRLSVIEEASESGERPEDIQEILGDIQEIPGDIQEIPGYTQKSSGDIHESHGDIHESSGGIKDIQSKAEGQVKPSEGEEAWVETKSQRENDNVTTGAIQPSVSERVILDKDQSMEELKQILTEAMEQADVHHQGYISRSDFGQVLGSHTLGLDLDRNEIAYITSEVDVYKDGWIAFSQVVPYLPDMLVTIYARRAELEMQQFGAYTEEEWCQILSPTHGELFLSKITGIMQNWRPDNFRPFLKDDVFEDSVVQYFHQADTNGDSEVDEEEFYNFLTSSDISQSIYQSQMEELYQLFHSYSADGRMNLEVFAAVARSLILMIYQNSYPNEGDWIRLQSGKFGDFSMNKKTGEVVLMDPSLPKTTSELIADYTQQLPSTGSAKEADVNPNSTDPKSGKKAKKHRKKKAATSDGSPGPSERAAAGGVDSVSSPPPLTRRRTPKVNDSASVDAQARPISDMGAANAFLLDASPRPVSGDEQRDRAVRVTVDKYEDPDDETGLNTAPATSDSSEKRAISEDKSATEPTQVPAASDNV